MGPDAGRRARRGTTWVGLFACLGLPGALGAQNTHAVRCPEPEARAFDFWIGEWDVVNRNRPTGGDAWYETGRATNRVYPVVGGCGVVEHWRGEAFLPLIVGFSVRAWNRETGRWDLVLLWPSATGSPSFGELHGGFEAGVGRFFATRVTPAGDTLRVRLTFSDVGEDSFRWENGVSADGGATFTSSWIMEQTRRPRLASGVVNGPTAGHGLCPGEPHRGFDHLVGEWAGTRVDAAGDTTGVRVRLQPILEGCAVMERAIAVDGSWEAFRVRAWEPEAARWVEYELASDRRRLVRREGESVEGGFVFEEPPGPGARRTVWEEVEGGALRRTVTAEGEGGRGLVSIVELTERLPGG